MFKKLMAVSATVAIAATMSVSAFAAEETPDLTATPDAGSIAVTDTTKLPEQKTGTQYTVMLFEESFDTTPDVSKIYYINQGDNVANLVGNMLVKATDDTTFMPEGNYIVRIGNDANLAVVNLTLKVEKEDEGNTTISIECWGDVDGSGSIAVGDINALVDYLLGTAKTFGDYTVGTEMTNTDVVWGDIDGSGSIAVGDINALVDYLLGTAKTFGDYTVGSPATVPTK